MSTSYKDIYKELITKKYNFSTEKYKEIFTDNDPDIFLFYFDMMNVYPLFPTVINLEIKTQKIKDYTFEDKNKITRNYSEKLLKHEHKVLNERSNIPESIIKSRIRPLIRKLFSYEIIDHISDNYNAEYVTKAWVKCYEILEHYKLLVTDDSTINYFGICEAPGGFIYAINHYIKTKTNKSFDFVIESLVSKEKQIFKPEKRLYNKYKNKYDYGKDGTGDVTNIENIKFYRKKYFDKKFNIISADCGLDCSKDYAKQEKNLLPVFFGQFLLALSLCSKGSNYFYKQFTLHENLSQEMVYFLSMLFNKVSVSRVLMTRPGSSEVYIICENFLKKKDEMNNILESLYKLYSNNKNLVSFLVYEFDKTFSSQVTDINNILLMRKITSIEFLIFRLYNNKYTKKHEEKIHKHIKDIVQHYKNYFIDLYKIEKLDDAGKLLS